MNPKKSLYDVLEVSAQASHEAIQASFERLKQGFLEDKLDSNGIDPGAYFQVIKDAYFVLGDKQRRAEYDEKMAQQYVRTNRPVVIEAESLATSSFSTGMKWLLIALLVGGGALYYKIGRDAELERQRLVAEQQKAALAALERQREIEETQLARQQQRLAEQQAERDEYRRNKEYEYARREADSVSRRLDSAAAAEQRAEERKLRDAEMQKQRAANEAQRAADEALRRLEREKAAVRQMEYENQNRGARVASIPPSSGTRPAPVVDTRNAYRQ